jgi:DNA-binding MarR family transcriptional regulator
MNDMHRGDSRERSPAATQAELEFVEEVALSFERQGLYRMAGRILAWLLICDPPEQSFSQLVEALQASKGSISTSIRFLVPGGLVERRSRPGDRRDYFRIRPDNWIELARRQSTHYDDIAAIAMRGLLLLGGASPERRQRLTAMHAFYVWLANEMPALWARWEREHGAQEDSDDQLRNPHREAGEALR